MQSLRYVVLHHTGFGEPHFDLMFESAPQSQLVTLRATHWPPAAGDELIRIGDHRRDYLDYEGPVSNNRGDLKRVVCGTCDASVSPAQIALQLHQPEAQLILLRLIETDRWRVVEVTD